MAIIALTFMIGANKASAESEPQRYIGLHDNMLPIESIYVINGDTKVRLDEITEHLYMTVIKEDGSIKVVKHGKQVTLRMPTPENPLLIENPLVAHKEGELLISLKYLTSEFGFKLEYFPNHRTLRIYRDNYPHMSHADFEGVISNYKKEKQSAASSSRKKADVYLTFDDGPNQHTLTNNKTLAKYDVPATFFFLGSLMKNNESIVKTVFDSGHYIGSHSMTHNRAFVYGSSESFIAEMAGGAEIIEQITGNPAKLVRVPYGSVPHVTAGMRKALISRNYKMWDWDVDSNDWRYTDKQASQIIKNVQEGVKNAVKAGDKDIIVLLHDRSQTTIALPAIIEWLQKEGYQLRTYEPNNHITQNFLHETQL